MENEPLVPDDALPVLMITLPLVPAVPASGVLTVIDPLERVEPKPLKMETSPPLVEVLRPATIVTEPPTSTPVPELNTKAPLDPTAADPV